MTKHTILFLAANPLGTARLALDEEARAIQAELERTGHRDRFELVSRWAVQPLDLLRELRRLKPTIVHFSGHGGRAELHPAGGPYRDIAGAAAAAGEGNEHGLFFRGADGRAHLVSTAALEETFGAAGASVKLVVLSACYSELQAAALSAHVEAIVGMEGAVADQAARSFAIGFYGGLGEGESVAAAFRQGRAALNLDGMLDEEKPRLSVKAGTNAEDMRLIAVLTGGVSKVTELPSRSRSTVSLSLPARPTPAYASAEVEALSKRLEDARARKEKLRRAGSATDQVDREILDLRRQLREGGQLRAGDALGDGRYLLVKIVGRGGFAVVWEAYDGTEQQRVAIKVLHSNLAGDALRQERFFRGARAMMRLQGPAVVRVLEARGEEGGFYYFVMEYVPGGNLRDAVLGGRLPEDHWTLLLSIGDVLAVAHSYGIIHRDIKPSNILLDEAGASKLTDFDLVSAGDTTGGTRTGTLGTVVYAAPECLDRPQDATARADVFGLGMTAIFCLERQELSVRTFRNPERTIAALECPDSVRAVLRRAVAWAPEDRFANAGEMVMEVRNALQEKTVTGTTMRFSGRQGVHTRPLDPDTRLLASGDRSRSDHTALPRVVEMGRKPAAKGRSTSLLAGAGTMVAVIVGVAILDEAVHSSHQRDVSARLEADVAFFAAAVERAERDMQIRADGIAMHPMLRASIETDAATISDMSGNTGPSDLGSPPRGEEVLEVFQFRGERTTSLWRNPKAALSVQPHKGRSTRFFSDGHRLMMSTSAPISSYHDKVAGSVVITAPVDLGLLSRRLAEYADAASLVMSGHWLTLVESSEHRDRSMIMPMPGNLMSEGALVALALKTSAGLPWASTGYRVSGAILATLLVGLLIHMRNARLATRATR